jgi:hypothetical protein
MRMDILSVEFEEIDEARVLARIAKEHTNLIKRCSVFRKVLLLSPNVRYYFGCHASRFEYICLEECCMGMVIL